MGIPKRYRRAVFAPEKYKLTALFYLCLIGGAIGVCDGIVTSGRPLKCWVTFLSGIVTLSLAFYLSKFKNVRWTMICTCTTTSWVFLTDFILYADPYYFAIGFSVPISAAIFLRARDALWILLVYGFLGLCICVSIHAGLLEAHYPSENVSVRTITALAIVSAMAGPTMLLQYLLARTQELEQDQRDRFETICDVGYGALYEANREGSIVFARGGLLSELGYGTAQVIGKRQLDFVLPVDRFALLRMGAGKQLEDFRCDREIRVLDAHGKERWVRLSGGVCRKPNGEATFVFAIQDIHDAVIHRHRVFEVARLQSLGNLCGGLAHDFNNLMTVIGIHASDIEDAKARSKILGAQRQAADLTAGLLTFARKQSFREQNVDLAEFLKSSRDLVERLLPANVQCNWNLTNAAARVRLDPAQLQQTLLNLVTNSRQALPNGGLIEIGLTTRQLPSELAEEYELAPGHFVALTVADNGLGMDEETASRAIEPFFTTKPRGVGTGLGLATAHGTAKRAGGTLVVRSQLEHGTEITLLFPMLHREELCEDEDNITPMRNEVPHTEPLHIMLVEDHQIVAATIEEMLEDCGHRVSLYGDAESAWADIHSGNTVDLLLSDVMLPGMSGVELVKKAMANRISLKTILISGYLTDDLDVVAQNPDSVRMLPKPFCREQLEQAMAEISVRRSRAA